MRMPVIFIVLFGVILAIGVTCLWLHTSPKISVIPDRTLIDMPVKIIISHLSPLECVRVMASCKDKNNNMWVSHAVFESDKDGIVNLARQAPLSGSYSGIEPMGLFWSMIPVDKKVSRFFLGQRAELEVVLSVFAKNKLVVQKKIYRVLRSANIERKEICEHGVIGTFFYPKDMRKGPGVIVIYGSGGGIPETKAELLASHGYVTLALGYFGVPGLPDKLERIPLEYFANAITWFKQQQQVDANRIALIGTSRGGELVLLLASMFPKEIAAVVANVPSSVVYGAFSGPTVPAWTYRGVAVPFMPTPTEQESLTLAKNGKISLHKGTQEDPFTSAESFLYDLNTQYQKIDAFSIAVENIRCPLLILSGEADNMWPSTIYGNRIMQRLDQKKSPIERMHLHFADAGHAFEFPYVPSMNQLSYHTVGKFWLTLGGTAAGNAHASEQAWHATLAFLADTIQSSNAGDKDN